MDVWARFEYKQQNRLLGWQMTNKIYRRLIGPLIGADACRALWPIFAESRATSDLYRTNYDLSVRTSPVKAAASVTAVTAHTATATAPLPIILTDADAIQSQSTPKPAEQPTPSSGGSALATPTAATPTAAATATCDILLLISAMILCCRGTAQSKITALFTVFNFSETDQIIPSEMSVLIRCVICAYGTICTDTLIAGAGSGAAPSGGGSGTGSAVTRLIGQFHRSLLESAFRDYASRSTLKNVGGCLSRRQVMEWGLTTPDVRLLLCAPIFGTTNSDTVRTKYATATTPAAAAAGRNRIGAVGGTTTVAISSRRAASMSGAIGAGSAYATATAAAVMAATGNGSQSARSPRKSRLADETKSASVMTATTLRSDQKQKNGGFQPAQNEHTFKFSMKNTRREVREIKALFDYIDFERVGYVPTSVFMTHSHGTGTGSGGSGGGGGSTAPASGGRDNDRNARDRPIPLSAAGAASTAAAVASEDAAAENAGGAFATDEQLQSFADRAKRDLEFKLHRTTTFQNTPTNASVSAAAANQQSGSSTRAGTASEYGSSPPLTPYRTSRPDTATALPASPPHTQPPPPVVNAVPLLPPPALQSISGAMTKALAQLQLQLQPPAPAPTTATPTKPTYLSASHASVQFRPQPPASGKPMRPTGDGVTAISSPSPAPSTRDAHSASIRIPSAAPSVVSAITGGGQNISPPRAGTSSAQPTLTYTAHSPEQHKQLSFVLPLIAKHHITNQSVSPSPPARTAIGRDPSLEPPRASPLRTARVMQTHFVRSYRGQSLASVAAEQAKQLALDIPTVIGSRARRSTHGSSATRATATANTLGAGAKYSELEDERANAERERKRKEKDRINREVLYKRVCYVFQHHMKTRGGAAAFAATGPGSAGGQAVSPSATGAFNAGSDLASPHMNSPGRPTTSSGRPTTAARPRTTGGGATRSVPFTTAIPGRLTFPELLLDVLYADVSSHERERLQQWIQQTPSKPVVKSIQRTFDRVDALCGFTGRVRLHHVLHALKQSVHKPLVEAFEQFRVQPDPYGWVDFPQLLGYLFNHRSSHHPTEKFKKRIAKWAKPSKLLSPAQQAELKQLFETFVYADQTDRNATSNTLSSTLLRYSTSLNGRKTFHPLSGGADRVSAIGSGVGTALIDPTDEEKRNILHVHSTDPHTGTTHYHHEPQAGPTTYDNAGHHHTPSSFVVFDTSMLSGSDGQGAAEVDVLHCSRLVEFLEKRYGMAPEEIRELLKESGLRPNEYITLPQFQLFFRDSYDLFINHYPA